MFRIEFCRAPSNYWIGVTEYNGGHIFASGRTMDVLVKHMKQQVRLVANASARQVVLSSTQTDTYEFGKKYKMFMTPIFLGRYWKIKEEYDGGKELMKVQKLKPLTSAPVAEPVPEPKQKHAQPGEYITKIKDGVMYVYELREVAKYKLFNTSNFNVDKGFSAPELPVLQSDSESQEENLYKLI